MNGKYYIANYLKIEKLSKYSVYFSFEHIEFKFLFLRLILTAQGWKIEEMCFKFTHFTISSSRQYL